MEEDNRSLHPSHPFRRYQYHRISEANQFMIDTCNNNNKRNKRASRIRWNDKARQLRHYSHQTNVLSLESQGLNNISIFSDATARKRTPSIAADMDQSRPILGMTAVDDDTENVSRSFSSPNRERNSAIYFSVPYLPARRDNCVSVKEGSHNHRQLQWSQQDSHSTTLSGHQHQQNKNPSWIEESQKLFHDYQQRFHRQSLTEQAKNLLERASVLVKEECNCSGKYKKDGNSRDSDDSNCTISSSTSSASSISIALCTEALELCKSAIRDQEESLNRNDCIGGSYLVTGDIRLRRKGEDLAAKIYCLRAAIRYQEGLYEESLEDCDAAIGIWNQHYESQRARRTNCFVRKNSSKSTGIGNKDSPKNNATTSTVSIPQSASSQAIKEELPPRPRKLSHKHLYLLKGRILAAMGRHRDALVWLTHPHNLPARTFRRSSALLEADAAMNCFLEGHLIQFGSLKRKVGAGSASNKTNDSRSKQDSPTKLAVTSPPFPIRMPTNKKLWPKVLHSIDRRLNEGMIGAFHANKTTRRNGEIRSNSASAIYHILRHGPVLFHHYQNENREKAKHGTKSPEPTSREAP